MTQKFADTTVETVEDEHTDIGILPGGPPPFYPEPPDDFGGDDRPGDDDNRPKPPLSNARLGMLMFLGAETMFFAALIGAFLVFRVASQTWPPPIFPKLPVLITGVNTLFLLYSALTMQQAQKAVRRGLQGRGIHLLALTALLGMVFLAIQGYEWLRLLRFGLTLSSGVYGATFYTLIGAHALHVSAAVVWLLSAWWWTKRGGYNASRFVGLAMCGMYWYYVVGLWPVLYGLVYLY
jgi:heme/copper-type cytochrome/quinol oxidase subunit 3